MDDHALDALESRGGKRRTTNQTYWTKMEDHTADALDSLDWTQMARLKERGHHRRD